MRDNKLILKDNLYALLDDLKARGIKGRSSSKSHLSTALMDWHCESGWETEKHKILNYEDKGYAFICYTTRGNIHCSLRHLFVLEDYRGQGIGKELMSMYKKDMEEKGCEIMRFFSDLPSIGFYEKLGFSWHGRSKGGLPFYYGDREGNLIELPKGQQKYAHTPI